jgi:hypothetical protein
VQLHVGSKNPRQAKGIIYLKWSGNVSLEEVSQATNKLEQLITELSVKQFDFLVDLSEFNLFKPETQPLVVEQQKMVVSRGLKRSAVVLKGAILKAQLGRTARESDNSSHEFHFDNYDEALAFLMK